jgi:hypothetical protein
VELSGAGVDAYVAQIAELLERYGVVLSSPGPGDPIEVLAADDGSLTFGLIGSLPDGRMPARSTLEVRERFRPVAMDRYQRDGYAYELIDRERDHRRAFHLHDAAWFQRHFLVVVHTHCEQPIGAIVCDHHEGTPLRDGFAGVTALMDAWTGSVDCGGVRCLD